MKNIRIVIETFDTRRNHEDFALTPYIGLVNKFDYRNSRVVGLGFCWGFWAIALGLAWTKTYK
jgi:hypothetical protein